MKATHWLPLIVLVLAPLVAAEEKSGKNTPLSDPKVILEESAKALKAVKAVRYQADYKGTGWLTAMVPNIVGKVIVGEQSEHDINEFQCDISIKKSDSEETRQVVAGSNGDVYYLIDKEKKVAHEDMDPAVLGGGSRDYQRVVLEQFASLNPWEEELKTEPDKLALAGTETVDGEECYRVNITGRRPTLTEWYISVKDLLPRFVRRTYPAREGDGTGTSELKIINLEVNPDLGAKPFDLKLPEGFTKTDDFAP